jgi:hypothetical protein
MADAIRRMIRICNPGLNTVVEQRNVLLFIRKNNIEDGRRKCRENFVVEENIF